MKKEELNSDEYDNYYQPNIDMVGKANLFDCLRSQHENTISFFRDIKKEKLDFQYAEGKWTIKEILQHLIDTERVFAYRALSIARNNKAELPGFDQDSFVAHSLANKRRVDGLLQEYKRVRMATISLFESFDHRNLMRIGIVSGNGLSVRAIAFIIVGHEKHHIEIVKQRYL